MKKLLFIIIFILNITNIYSQNIFNLAKPAKNILRQIKYPVTIQRITVVETSRIESAVAAAVYQSQLRQQEQFFINNLVNQQNVPMSLLTQEIKQFNCNPEKLYGGYNYLRTCSLILSGKEWKHINKVDSYNGAHHIINVSTLKILYKESVKSYNNGIIANYPFLKEMLNNAPAIFHQYHNNPMFTNIFHSQEIQLQLYNHFGVKGILDSFFRQIQKMNEINGIPPISDEIIIGTYLEAKLWTDYYGLKWE